MIEYTADKWGIFFAFQLKGSVFPKAFGFAAVCGLATGVLHWYLSQSDLRDEMDIGKKGTTVVSMFTFVLGFLLVFRAQQAYSRWWEGGSLLQELRGEWFNAFSCLLAFGNPAPDKHVAVVKFNHQLARLLSMLHGAGLAQVCSYDEKFFEVIDLEDKDVESMAFLDSTFDSCEIALQWIQRLIVEANEKVIIKVAPPILSRVYNQLGNGIVKLSRARKIAKFPIPFPFAQMVTVMLLTHWFLAAWVCATSIESRAWAIILSFSVVISFWSMNFIALELEDPFGDDANDLPLEQMQKDLNESIKALLEPLAMKTPEFNFCLAYHEKMHIKRVDFNNKLHESVRNHHDERPKDAFEQAEEMKKLARVGSKSKPPPQIPPAGPTAPPASVAPAAHAAPAATPGAHAHADLASLPDLFAEYLKGSKDMEQQLSRAVAELEKNGKQLIKNCEMQAGLYELQCDFWGVLSNMFQRASPTTWHGTSFNQVPLASSIGSAASMNRKTSKQSSSGLQPILAAREDYAEDTVVVNGVTTIDPRSQSTSFDPSGHMPDNGPAAPNKLQALLPAQQYVPEFAIATDAPDASFMQKQDILMKPPSPTTSVGPSSRMGLYCAKPPTGEEVRNISNVDKLNEVADPMQVRIWDEEAEDPLLDAIRRGDTIEVQQLLSNGADVNKKDSICRASPLHLAASGDQADTTSILLVARADVDAQSGIGATPLIRAAESGASAVAPLLLLARAEVNAVDSEDMTPLHWAARLGHEELAMILIDSGAEINKTTDAGYTPYAMAQDWGTTTMANLLEERGGVR